MNIGLFTDTFYPEINGVANSAYQLSLALKKEDIMFMFLRSATPMQKMRMKQSTEWAVYHFFY
ncbi:hypothetical protein Q5O14_03155 [Eubacteriaceae bacterium ES2]|nr:hypothetical protein Q5O14_03155 [Eubacteriaceae bacterium ES2]